MILRRRGTGWFEQDSIDAGFVQAAMAHYATLTRSIPTGVTPMHALPDIANTLPPLSRAEKAQRLHWIASDVGDASAGIERTPEICGGEARIVRTRMPVWLLVQACRLGSSEAELLRSWHMPGPMPQPRTALSS